MMKTVDRRRFLAGSGVSAGAALLWRQSAWASSPAVETAYVNAKVWTGQGCRIFSDAIGVSGTRIVALGEDAVRAGSDRRTRIVDLDGAFVTPGFIDSHVHFVMASLQLGQPSLRDAADRADFERRIAGAARDLPAGQWLTGGNWDNDRWGGELPDRGWIDAATPHTPVAVVRYDLHMVLLNSRALDMLGIVPGIADVDGGVIGRDAAGRLTGIFKDAAKDMVMDRIPPASEAAIDAACRRGMALALGKGVTQVHEAGVDWRMFHSARRMQAAGALPLRVHAMVPLADWERLAAIVAEEGRGDDRVWWGGCKAVFDGSLGSRTALFYEPYLDDPSTRGIMVTDPEALAEGMLAADAAGMQLAVHAIGDRANDMVLDMMAKTAQANGARDRRFRIEHAQHLRPAALARFAKQQVIASVQPYHAIDDGRWAVRRIGPDRLETTYAFHALLENGARVCFGSDWPVAPLDPLTGLEAAVLRRTLDGANPGGWYPQQRVGLAAAMLAYTREAAFAAGHDTRTGSLTPGLLAGFVVWDRDLTTIPPDTLGTAQVLRTVVGGAIAHG